MKIRETSLKNRMLKKKKMGLFVSIKSIQEGLLRLSKHVSALIKLFKPSKLQKLFMTVSSIETLKSPINRKLPYVSIYSSIKEFKGSRWFEMKFLFGFYTVSISFT